MDKMKETTEVNTSPGHGDGEPLAEDWEQASAEDQKQEGRTAETSEGGTSLGDLLSEQDCANIGSTLFGLMPSMLLKSDVFIWTPEESRQWGTSAKPILSEWIERMGADRDGANAVMLLMTTVLIMSGKVSAYRKEQEVLSTTGNEDENSPA